jgi:hypothetical protein
VRSDYWDRILEGQKTYVAEDFESAALRLVTEQVLYASDPASRVAYSLVATYQRAFSDALDALGLEITVRADKGYACALPRGRTRAPFPRANLDETLFALVLRKIYDTHIMAADINDKSEVECPIEEFVEAYRLATGREPPTSVGGLRALLRQGARWGIAREGDAQFDGQPFTIVIRPAIVDLLGEGPLHRLAAYARPQAASDVIEIEAPGESK